MKSVDWRWVTEGTEGPQALEAQSYQLDRVSLKSDVVADRNGGLFTESGVNHHFDNRCVVGQSDHGSSQRRSLILDPDTQKSVFIIQRKCLF